MNPQISKASCCCAFERITIALFICCSFEGALAGIQTNASSLSEETLLQIKFDQKVGNQLALDLQFRGDDGKLVPLGDYFGQRPVILVMGYYECPMLCSLVLNGAVEALQELRAKPGQDFEIVNVSIDATESPEIAAAQKRVYVKRYGRDDSGKAWHFLTGDKTSIEQLADEVGFHYAYDARLNEFAHPSGLVIVTPDGKISRYLFGVSFSARELDTALKQAGRRNIGSPVEQLLLLCFHYRPLTGQYGDLILAVVRASGVMTLAGVGWMIIVLRRRHRGKASLEVRS